MAFSKNDSTNSSPEKELRPHDPTGLRDLPPILLSDHVAEIFKISRAGARKKMRRGACGECHEIDGRPVILREDFIEHLKKKKPLGTATPTSLPKSDPEVVRLLRGTRPGRCERRDKELGSN